MSWGRAAVVVVVDVVPRIKSRLFHNFGWQFGPPRLGPSATVRQDTFPGKFEEYTAPLCTDTLK